MAEPMKRLGSLFDVYKTRFKPPQATVESEVIQVVREVLGYELQAGQVSYTTGSRTVSLHVPSVLKTEIIKQKAAVLATLSSSLGVQNAPKDIR